MRRRTALAVAWTLVILAACWLPRSRMPVSEGGPSLFHRFQGDKLIHAGLFAGFAMTWRRATSERSRPILIGLGLGLAVLTEVVQGTSWVGRDADPWDALADSVGLLIGLWFEGILAGRGR